MGGAILLEEIFQWGWALGSEWPHSTSSSSLLHVTFQLSTLAMMPATSCHASLSCWALFHLVEN